MAPGVRSDPDPVEYVRIAPGRLVPRDGRYELRVTNELEEVLYLDRLRLLAVDHPADVEVYPDEGMTEPPKPFRLFAARDPRTPRGDRRPRARRDRAPARGLDRAFVDDLPLERIRGYAKEHALTLDLSALPAVAHAPAPHRLDRLRLLERQRRRAPGGPRRVPPAARGRAAPTARGRRPSSRSGIPVGRPQTIVVDLAGPLGPSRRGADRHDDARLLGPGRGRRARRRTWRSCPWPSTRCAPTSRERGFSAEASPGRREPLVFDYARVSWLSPWKTMPGRYTREGDVRPLLAAADDAFVVSKPGDELALSFDASALPPLATGAGPDLPARRPTASARRWTSTPRARTSSCRCRTTGMKAYPYAETDAPAAVRQAAGRPRPGTRGWSSADRADRAVARDPRHADATALAGPRCGVAPAATQPLASTAGDRRSRDFA